MLLILTSRSLVESCVGQLTSYVAHSTEYEGALHKLLKFQYLGDIDICTTYDTTIQGFHQVWYQCGEMSTVFGVFEDLKFKISEGSDQNWCFPDPAQLAVSAKLRQLTGHL